MNNLAMLLDHLKQLDKERVHLLALMAQGEEIKEDNPDHQRIKQTLERTIELIDDAILRAEALLRQYQ